MATFSLNDTLSDMQTHVAALEKEPVQQTTIGRGNGEDPFTFLAKALDRARTVILDLHASQRGSVEIEARLGIFCHNGRGDDERIFPHCAGAGVVELFAGGSQTRFFSGVTRGAFEQMKHSISNLSNVQTDHLNEIVYSYADKRRIRCEVGAKKGILEQKQRLMEVNIALPAANYDIRLTLALENEEAAEQLVVDGWESKRAKLRTSFTDPQGNCTLGPWSLDFTSVSSSEQDDGGQQHHFKQQQEETAEVELELSRGAVAEWLDCSGDDADKETSRLASRLLDTLKRLNPLERAPSGNVLLPVERSTLHEGVRQKCAAILQTATGIGGGGRAKFPGTMPVNLCRKDVALVQQGGYWLAEKTDGVRYLLMILPTGGGGGGGGAATHTSVLVDRSLAVYTFPGAEGLALALPPSTVLDGELVYNRLTSTYIFLVFDILCWGNEVTLQARFSDRLRAIHQRVLPWYEKAVQKGVLPMGQHLRLVGKKFYRRTHIARLFDRVSEEEGHRVYKDAGCITEYLHYLGIGPKTARGHKEVECLARYYHKTDGIVFQPDRAYQCATDLHFFKWKWMDTVTIDFSVIPTPYKVTCGAGGQGQLDLTKQIRLEAPDMMRMRADMNAARCRIAELGFSVEAGFWFYKNLRPDKSDPNYFTTVCTTMLELAEGIEEEELQYRMMVHQPAEDDWAQQVHLMRRAAVIYRKKHLKEDADRDAGEEAMQMEAGDGEGGKRKQRKE